MNKNRIYTDMLLNITAAGVPLVVLQLVIYPFAAKVLEPDAYGMMIAIYALLLLVNDSLGKSANNIRLINNDEEENCKGNYNLIVALYSCIGFIVTIAGVTYYGGNGDTLNILIMVITGILMVYNAYLIVFFRIRLNYVAILVNAIFMSIGFAIGFFAFELSGKWGFIFLAGQMGSFLFLVFKTDLLREPFSKNRSFKTLLSDTTILAVSIFLSQGMGQVDKLLLFPLLGGATVSVYYTASLAGKIMSLATGPVNSVILTYITKKETLSKKAFRKYITMCALMCSAMAIVILLLSRPVLGFLFPRFVEEAMELVPYTTTNIFLYVMAGMITPLVMRYCNIRWQIIINGLGFVLYCALSVILLFFFGVKGFCVGIGISHLVRLLVMIDIYYKRAYTNKES